MPIQLTILEQIRQNILSTLAGVTVANGYQINLTVESYLPAEGNLAAGNPDTLNFLCVVSQAQSESDDTRPQRHVQYWQPFDLTIFLLSDIGDENPPDYYLNLCWGEITEALTQDRNRGVDVTSTFQLAIDTVVGDWIPLEQSSNPGGLLGLLISPKVKYRTLENNPYSA